MVRKFGVRSVEMVAKRTPLPLWCVAFVVTDEEECEKAERLQSTTYKVPKKTSKVGIMIIKSGL